MVTLLPTSFAGVDPSDGSIYLGFNCGFGSDWTSRETSSIRNCRHTSELSDLVLIQDNISNMFPCGDEGPRNVAINHSRWIYHLEMELLITHHSDTRRAGMVWLQVIDQTYNQGTADYWFQPSFVCNQWFNWKSQWRCHDQPCWWYGREWLLPTLINYYFRKLCPEWRQYFQLCHRYRAYSIKSELINCVFGNKVYLEEPCMANR